VGRSGTKLPRIKPWAASSESQVASFTSVLRPGTFFTCAALASSSSNSPSARGYARPASNRRRWLPYPRRTDRGPVGEGPRKGRHSHRLLQPPAVDHRLSRLRLLARPPRHLRLRATPAKAAVVKMPK